ncbi:hypothetical protein [Actibacterium ureilyticum]|uniref:hypothetical protein n=1 Tax=Actibacterium ureilyticum TaxID=1590614 RepID=UPI001140D96D|nr:hypothetical protein [Actibacterium ureilyticum]
MKMLGSALPLQRFCNAESRSRRKIAASAQLCCSATKACPDFQHHDADFFVIEREAARRDAGLGSFLPIFVKVNHLRFVRFKAPLTKRCQNVSGVIGNGQGQNARPIAHSEDFDIAGDNIRPETTSENENNKRGSTGFAPRYDSSGAPLCSSRSPFMTSYRHHRTRSARDMDTLCGQHV